MELTTEYWDELYREKDTAWDLGVVSPPIKAYIDQLGSARKEMDILIPGCGNSYEAAYLLDQGFTSVTLIDVSTIPTSRLTKQYEGNPNIKIICGNFFDYSGQFDLILEQTFFCAIDPSLRQAYANKAHELLKPGGKLAGVLFNRTFDERPPFGGSIDEYRELFEEKFTIKTLEPCYNSIQPRAGNEAFVILKK
jgi:methyl halide transferase